MWWTEEKLAGRIQALTPWRYREAVPLPAFRLTEDPEGAPGAAPPDWEPETESAAEAGVGFEWAGRDRYLWLSAKVRVPAEWTGRRVLGLFDFGRSGGGNNSGFESLLYVDGRVYQGVDSNHREVFLPPDSCGRELLLQLRLWSGLGGYEADRVNRHRILRAELAWLDEAADDLYYTAAAALDTVRVLPADRPERSELLSLLDRAFLEVDWSKPGSEGYYASVACARERLRDGLACLPKGQHGAEVRCIGHTHIDVAWLWRLRHTREKAARSFSTVLRLMELYPEYVFLQTQPQLYDDLRRDYPGLYADIRARAAEGRWEAGGAMWLEADCNLPSGESLVRQLLYGTRFFQEEFGTECRYLWLPDVFGYSWALPQILRLCGIEAFMTTKISWNQYNRMPHDTFRWRGIDGTEILTHFITTPDPGQQEGAFYYTYNGTVSAESVQGIWQGYRDKALNRKLLLAYGYGDGGGGVNRDMLEAGRRLREMPGLPRVTTGRADEYFRELRETVERAETYVHTWDGELYLELHRGTYTSQAYNKRMNRKLELMYREAEWLGSAAAVLSGDWAAYPAEDLRAGWTIVLRNQFHDILPGSSIREVYEDSRTEYAEAERLAENAWAAAAGRLEAEAWGGEGTEAAERTPTAGVGSVREPQAFTVLNSAWFPRADTVRLPGEAGIGPGRWTDARGIKLPAQRTEEGWTVLSPALPPMACAAVIRFEPGQGDMDPADAGGASGAWSGEPDTPFRYAEGRLETPHYVLEWNGTGQLARIYDRRAEREVLAPGTCGNVLQVFEDRPKGRHEAWDVDLFYTEKMRTVDALESVRLAACGPVEASVEMVWRYLDSRIVQRMTVYTHSRRIDFRTEVDWHEQRQLLKAAFPVDVRATEARYDIQFGSVKRPTHWNTSWDWARFETVGHQWADLSERGFGVSLLNDCKYGYDIKDNVLRLSLIKSAMVPDATADQGLHRFTYALLPHGGDPLEGGTVEEAWSLNRPLTALGRMPTLPAGSLFRCDKRTVRLDTVKKAEDQEALVLRLYEFGGSRGTVSLTSDWGVSSWQETDLLERPAGPQIQGPGLTFTLKPFEIKTFLVRFG